VAEGTFDHVIHLAERGKGERREGDIYVCVLCIFIDAGLLLGNIM
jgi:hypothetical protein